MNINIETRTDIIIPVLRQVLCVKLTLSAERAKPGSV